MNSPVIFIDIDGPLAYGTWMDGEVEIETFRNKADKIKIPYAWVQEDCDALAQIVEKTYANLVVSSDWKQFYTLRDLRGIFQNYGIHADIIDTTSHHNPMRKMSSPPEWDRACQIAAWVKTYKPRRWIAIDDMPLGYYFKHLRIPQWRHVQVDGDFGKAGKLRNKIDECVIRLTK